MYFCAMDRHFYHSFPRIRPGDKPEKIIKDGLNILESIRHSGLLLAPEIVEWKQPIGNDKFRTIANRQIRMSFTELDSSELGLHSKLFGPFSLEFAIPDLRKLGALPVIYVPQHLEGPKNFSSIGTSIVVHMHDIKYLINQLHQLHNYSDLEFLKKQYPEAESIHPNAEFTLNNENPENPGEIVQSFKIPFGTMKDIISYLSYRNAPLHLMEGILTAVQNLFYPTDDQIHDELLAYYRQREWRLIAGVSLEGKSQSRPLKEEEKMKLESINAHFWNRELNDGKIILRRKDEAVVIEEYWDGHISKLITKVRVPKEAEAAARHLFEDKVFCNEFE